MDQRNLVGRALLANPVFHGWTATRPAAHRDKSRSRLKRLGARRSRSMSAPDRPVIAGVCLLTRRHVELEQTKARVVSCRQRFTDRTVIRRDQSLGMLSRVGIGNMLADSNDRTGFTADGRVRLAHRACSLKPQAMRGSECGRGRLALRLPLPSIRARAKG
jgi:hypothetical protein